MNTDCIRDLVRAECDQPSNRFGTAFFSQHLELVAHYGCELATRLGADPEVVTLAGYLHDLSAVRDFGYLQRHHLESASMARGILLEGGWQQPVVEAVCACIESHSNPVPVGRGTLEQVCVSNADVLSHLARPAYWFFYLYQIRGMSYTDGLAWMRTRVERLWGELTAEARSLVNDEHAALIRLLAHA